MGGAKNGGKPAGDRAGVLLFYSDGASKRPAAAANLSAFVSADSVCELTRYNRMKADRKPVRGKFDLFKRPDTGKE